MASVTELRKVGRYEIVREIGRGGTAVVYLARQTDLDRNVALKELAAFRASDPAFVQRFLRESRLTGSLNHPNIVTVHEYFEHEGTPFIAMEYFERGSLRPHAGGLDLPRIAGVLEGLLAGLAYAETQRIVHRDLKPENVMVSSGGTVKIADFGMAKARELHAAVELTASGTTVGTPAYMAPEQARGSAVGPATDLYSLGVIAYELLAGRVPFDQAEAPMAIMLRHLNDPVPPLRSLEPDVDPELADWVERLLAKDPSDRPQSATAAWDDLEEIVIRLLGPRWRRGARLAEPERVAEVAVGAPETGSRRATLRLTRVLRTSPRTRWVAIGALAALVVAGGAAAELIAGGGSPSATPRTESSTTVEHKTTTHLQRHRDRGPTLSEIRMVGTKRASGSLRLSGAALGANSVVVRDRDLADGHGLLLVRQRGITSRARGGTYGPVSFLVRKGKGFVRIDVAARPGVFSLLTARRAGAHAVTLRISRPPAVSSSTTTVTTTQPVTSTTPVRSTTPVTSTTSTTTSKPPPKKNKPPPIDTG